MQIKLLTFTFTPLSFESQFFDF